MFDGNDTSFRILNFTSSWSFSFDKMTAELQIISV